MKKIKVTYINSGIIRAKIIIFDDWFSIFNKAQNTGIYLNDILKVEIVIEAEESNTDDLTIWKNWLKNCFVKSGCLNTTGPDIILTIS